MRLEWENASPCFAKYVNKTTEYIFFIDVSINGEFPIEKYIINHN